MTLVGIITSQPLMKPSGRRRSVSSDMSLGTLIAFAFDLLQALSKQGDHILVGHVDRGLQFFRDAGGEPVELGRYFGGDLFQIFVCRRQRVDGEIVEVDRLVLEEVVTRRIVAFTCRESR